jgi:S1-C subfamily serine protease
LGLELAAYRVLVLAAFAKGYVEGGGKGTRSIFWKMIGMNTAILSGTRTFSGIGFAIPSDTITKIVPILIEKGYYPHPYLGLIYGILTSDLAQDNGIYQ